MTDSNGILSLLLSFFRSIYEMGNTPVLFGVSINSFVIALAIMSIILTSLINFARVYSGNTNMVGDTVRGTKTKIRKGKQYISDLRHVYHSSSESYFNSLFE